MRRMARGSLKKIGEGRWWGRIDVPTNDGKRKQLSKTFRTLNKKEAHKLFETWKAEIWAKYEKWEEEKSISFIFARYIEYLQTRRRQNTLKQATCDNYWYVVKNITNYFQNNNICKPSKITKQTAQELINWLHEHRKLEAGYVKYHMSRLKAIIDFAVKEKYIAANPLRSFWNDLLFPRQIQLSVEILEKHEIDKILKASEGIIKDIIIFALHSGIRRGELAALEDKHVFFRDQVIKIEQQFTADGKNIIPPKSKHSIRTVPLNQMLAHIIADKMKEKKKMQLRGVPPSSFLFTWPDGRPIRPDYISKAFCETVKKAGLNKNITFHVLRHTFASNLIRAGVDVKVVCDILGHHNPAFTWKTYIHLFNDQKKEAARKYEDFW